MKNIELPRKVVIGEGAIKEVKETILELDLYGNSLVISDQNTRDVAGRFICDQLNSYEIVIESSSEKEIEKIVNYAKRKNVKYLIAAGGGTVIDITKVAALEAKIPFLSVPTAASHDGIASSRASIKRDKPVSIQTHCPIAIIADISIIKKAPSKLLASGCADAISNYTAVLDWKLAHDEKNEYYGDYAAALSMMSAQIVMENAEKIKDNVSIAVEALISSGVAMGIAGSSRPCSGSEHLFSHALDMICEKPALHGEQCGVGTIMMAYLHNADWAKVRDSLKIIGAPINAEELDIPEEDIIEALTIAHEVRDRYTILRNGLSEKEALEIAKETGVI